MRVVDVVERDALALRAGDDVRTAAAQLVGHRLSVAPVVDEGRRVVGSVGDADLLRAVTAVLGAPGTAVGGRWSVSEVMAAAVPVRLDDDLHLALSLLRLRDVRCLCAVDDDDELVGVVRREHLLALLCSPDLLLRSRVLDVLADTCGPSARLGWDVQVDAGVVHLLRHPGAPARGGERELAAVLARTVPGVVDVLLVPALGGPASRGTTPQG